MEPQATAATATEPADKTSTQNTTSTSDNISRYIKEHEVSATRRNMLIHQDDDGAESPDEE